MVSNQQLANMFAQGATRGKTKSMFIDGDTIYSYGYHFPIARRSPVNGYLFNTRGYSNTTARHKAYVSRAIGNYTELRDANTSYASEQMERNKKEITTLYQKLGRARSPNSKSALNYRINYLTEQNRRINNLME